VRVRFYSYIYLFINCLIIGEDYSKLFVGPLKSDISSSFCVTFIKVKVANLLLHQHDNLIACVFLKIRSTLLTHFYFLTFRLFFMPTVSEENVNSSIIEHS